MPRLLSLLACLLCLVQGAWADTLVFGVTPQFERRQLFAIWTPILAELSKRTGHEFQLATAPNIREFERQYNAGAYDLAYMNPYLAVANPQSYQPILRDATPIRGILVVRKDSAIRSVADLAGKEIAFPAPNAIGASLLIRAELTRKFKLDYKPRYVQSHTTVYLQVAQGLAEAGGGVQKTFDEQKDAVRNQLRIIYTTSPVPSLPIAAHPRLPAATREAIRDAFLALAATPEGEALLREVPIGHLTVTSMKDYEPLRELGLQDFFITEP
jgi:ABC-type phosphate/phosphonate transport system substrate-binding protein